VQGALVWLSYGSTVVDDHGDQPGLIYKLNIGFFNDNGSLISTTQTVPMNNYKQIFGNEVSYDIDGSLITSCRVFSMGLRCLPAVEQVTDTSLPYVAYFIGGQLSAYDIEQCFDNSNIDVRTIIKNSFCAEVYGNNQGCTVRYDPVQIDQLLDMLPLQSIMGNAYDRSNIRFPAIALYFSQSLANGANLPFIIHTQLWMEAVLKQPTPLYGAMSPTDPCFASVKSTLSSAYNIYPLVTKGHTFDSFQSQMGRFLEHSRGLFRAGSNLVRAVRRPIRKIRQRIRKANKNRKNRRKKRRSGRRLGGKRFTRNKIVKNNR
jgi:hypothetical protein